VPSLSITPARITEPAVGAWVWASGSQVCTGKIGTLMAKAMAKEMNSHRAVVWARTPCCSARIWRSKVTGPPLACRYDRATMPTSMNAEPNIVYRKNFMAAYLRSP